MSRIAIIGGHGKVALHLSRILTGQGHQVSSLIRNPDHAADVRDAGATPVLADVETATAEELADQLRGHDAVVWSAGAGGGNPERTYAVDRDAAIRSMDAAAAAGVQRYVMVSYLGAGKESWGSGRQFVLPLRRGEGGRGRVPEVNVAGLDDPWPRRPDAGAGDREDPGRTGHAGRSGEPGGRRDGRRGGSGRSRPPPAR